MTEACKREGRDKVSATPGLYPPPGTSPSGERASGNGAGRRSNSFIRAYCAIGYAKQAAVVLTGTLVATGWTRSTPSSVEQKLRFPVVFGATGAPPTTNAALNVPTVASPVARKVYPLLPGDPGTDCARALSSKQAAAADGVHGAGPPRLEMAAAYPTVG